MSTSYLPLLLVASLLAGSASAQTTFHFGPRVGGSLAGATSVSQQVAPTYYNRVDRSPLLGWQAGVVLEARFGRLALQPAVVFSQKGSHDSQVTTMQQPGPATLNRTDQQTATRTNWLELPLNLVYTTQVDKGWQFFGGPYVALGLGGRRTGTTYLTSTTDDSVAPQQVAIDQPVDFTQRNYGPAADYQRLDAGMQLGVGYRLGPWQVQAGYQVGLRNLRTTATATDYYNRGAQLTATYWLPRK